MNIPQKWRDNLMLVIHNDNRVSIINTWVKPAGPGGREVPLGDIFEDGSADHWIVAKKSPVLVWTEYDVVPAGDLHGTASATRYAKRVYVRGIRGLHPMRRGLRTGMGRVRSWLNSKKQYSEWRSGFRPNIRLYHGLDDPTLSERQVRRGRVRPSEYHRWNPKWSQRHIGSLRDYLDQPDWDPKAGGGKYHNIYLSTNQDMIEEWRVIFEGRPEKPDTGTWGQGPW